MAEWLEGLKDERDVFLKKNEGQKMEWVGSYGMNMKMVN